MTYKEAQNQAFSSVAASAEAQIMAMLANYRKAQAGVLDNVNRMYATLAGVKPENWYLESLRGDKLETLKREIDENYRQYSTLADAQMEALISDAMKEMYYKSQYIQMFFTPATIATTTLPEVFVKAAVTGQADAMKAILERAAKRYLNMTSYAPQYGTLTQLLLDRNNEAVAAIQQAVTQAILKGKGIRELTQDIKVRFDTSIGKAERIARTETLRVASVGQSAYDEDLRNAGITTMKMWMHVTTTTGESRQAHCHLDGKTIEMDEKFTSNGHQALFPRGFGEPSEDVNCRCTKVTLVNGVAPETRVGYNPKTGKKEVFSFKSYDDWIKDIGAAS